MRRFAKCTVNLTTLTWNMKDEHLHEQGEGHEEEEVPEEDERQPLLILSRTPYLLQDHFEVFAGAHLVSHDNLGVPPDTQTVLISLHEAHYAT